MPAVAPKPSSVGASLETGTQGGCTYCGLPVAADESRAAGLGSPSSERYCCYGCRFAHAVVQEQGERGAIRWTVIRLGLAIFFTMNLMAFTMTMWSLDVYDVEPDPFQLKLYALFRWLSMVLALPVLFLLGVPLLQNAVQSWRQRVFSTDLLIGLAVAAAYVTSMVNVIRGSGTTYFEVGATVLVMITLGRWIEATGKQKANESLDQLISLLPDWVVHVGSVAGGRLRDPADHEEVASADVRVGDFLRIRAGERFPMDAILESGSTTIDEQVFTGESEPVHRSIGDAVLAGTVNLDGDVVVRVTAEFRQGAFGRLLRTLQEARHAKGYHQRLADKVASLFFPLTVLIASLTFAWHLGSGIDVAIHAAMSVLLIACPCALGLATPLAVWTALSTAVRRQVLFRSGEAIEQLADTRAVCFDKTGTLTTGTPQVIQTAFFGDTDFQNRAIRFAYALADASSHPFSKAVVTHLCDQKRRSPDLRMRDIRTVAGGGIEATAVDGTLLRLGSVEFSCCKLHDDEGNVSVPSLDLCVSCKASVSLPLRVQLDRLRMAADQQASSIVLLSVDRIPAVGFLVAESLRPEAQTALQSLGANAERVIVLSGDRPAKGRYLKDQLNVPGLLVECSLNPEQKVLRVAEVRRRYGTTVMVGDGINDAPALAASDIGIAMGCGADVSRDSAQVCLLSNDLCQIPWAMRLAQRTTSIIRQNLFWAFGYNMVGVCLAAAGVLNPAIAAGLMIASSLLVISNSLRLLRGDVPTTPESESGNREDESRHVSGGDGPGSLASLQVDRAMKELADHSRVCANSGAAL